MIPTPPEHINTVIITCKVRSWGNVVEDRTYQLTRAICPNGYRSSTSGGTMYYTHQNQGPDGEPIVRKIEWAMQHISEFDNWKAVNFFLDMMRAKDIEYIWE